MAYSCRIERDSLSPSGDRLVSFLITYPRIVLAEAVTHRLTFDGWNDDVSLCERSFTRDISKNSASSRAIPFERMLAKVRDDPFTPFWTANRKGMQGDPLAADKEGLADEVWRYAREDALKRAGQLHALGVHKQAVNRLLEPFAWVTQLATSSRWDNFFALRCHGDADPHLRRIARMMYLEYHKSVPQKLRHGQWHLPFVDPESSLDFHWVPDTETVRRGGKVGIPDLIKFSAARCAWLSYESHDKDGSPEAMIRTFDRLLGSVPVHASPLEHQATPFDDQSVFIGPCFISNLAGWLQARKLLPGEAVTKYEPSQEEVDSWGLT
jgi:thymidylate synthase ThyX